MDSNLHNERPKKALVSFFQLFRYATTKEILLMCFACVFASIAGVGLPLFSLVFGNLTNSLAPPAIDSGFSSTNTSSNSSSSTPTHNPQIIDQASEYSSYFVYIGIGVCICNFISMGVFLNVSEKVSGRIRKAYFEALLKQEIGWFDVLNPNELASKVSIETYTIQQGIGDKIPTFLMAFCTIISGFIMGFARGWQLTLVLCGALPFLSVAGGLYAWVLTNIKKKTNEAYISSSALAEQSLNAIKTVKSLSSEDFEMKNFAIELKRANKITLKYGILVGFAIGFIYFVMLSNYGLAYWFGSITIEERWYNEVTGSTYDVGNVITVFFCVMMGSMFLAQLAPPLKAFTAAKQAAANVFNTIDRIPKILIDDKSKKIVKQLEGDIEFKDIEFAYPTRETVKVLKKISFKIEKNKKTAFVGESGSGKSTIVALIERFYDPSSGIISVDGLDLKLYNLNSLRKNIGYVGQEPVLFSGTVKENLLFGKEEATDAEIIQALKKANAFDFVDKLQNKLDTFIGIGGSQLSGGQKQRLAIARAILKNPPILLLDEATSALDRVNEMVIQKTLDEISASKTTIVIAHRLSTIQDADRIYVMSNGIIDDFGTHDQLLNRHGKYEALVKIQLIHNDDKNEAEEMKIKDENDGDIPDEFLLKKNKSISKLFNNEKEEVIELAPKLQKRLSHQNEKAGSHLEILVNEELKEIREELKHLSKKELEMKKKKVFKRLFKYVSKHMCLFLFATFGSIINGGILPIMAIVMGEILQTLAQFWLPDFREKVNFLAGMFVVIASGAFFANIFQVYLYSILGERISYELKLEAYNKIIRKPIKFFDDPKNNPGILSARISIDTQQVNNLASNFIGVIIQGISGFIVGMIIAFFYSWELTLVALAFSPLVTIGQSYQQKLMAGFQSGDESYKTSASIIMESVMNIRTVASFCNETRIEKKYNEQVDIPIKSGARKGLLIGLAFGGSYFLLFVYYALIFYIAALLQDSVGLTLKEFFIALFAILMAAGATGAASQFLPDVGECVQAGEKVFSLLDSQEEENYIVENDKVVLSNDFVGKIEIKNLYFKYPTRDNYVFENFNLMIKPGKKVAFVGPSGCGKFF